MALRRSTKDSRRFIANIMRKALRFLAFRAISSALRNQATPPKSSNFVRESTMTFPMFGKIEVNGPAAHPLYRYLKGEAKGVTGTGADKLNFTRILVDRKGGVAARFAPAVQPKEVEKEIAKLL